MGYSPTLGRWLETDPIGYADSLNLYEDVHGNPVTHLDPLGLYDAAGHFYTSYMVGIAAGMTPAQAYELAYFSQLPDQVPDYDAIRAGNVLASPLNGATDNAAALLEQSRELQWAEDIQKVLHSLHGGAAAPRQACLQKLISSGTLQPWEKGLVLHAFGDSYAHTYNGGKTAYPPPFGHAFTGNGGHAPDIIGNNVPQYQLYIHDLYLALGGNPATEASSPQMRALRNVSNGFVGNTDAAAQIKALRRLASTPTFGYSNPYAPELGGIDPALGSLNRQKVQSLIDKIKKACSC